MIELLLSEYLFRKMHGQTSAALFDFDGVIVDSTESKHTAFVEAAEAIQAGTGAALDHALHGNLSGVERLEVAKWLQQTAGIEPSLFLSRFQTSLAAKAADIKPRTEIIELVHQLDKGGTRMGIVSAAPTETIIETLRRVGLDTKIFGLGVFGSQFGKKTHILQRLISDEKLNGDQTFFFGDMPSDRHAARQVSTNFVRVPSWGGDRVNWA